MSVSVCSAHEHISTTTCPTFTRFPCTLPTTVARPHFRRRCDTLSVSGFMDDMTSYQQTLQTGRNLIASFCALNLRTFFIFAVLKQWLLQERETEAIVLISKTCANRPEYESIYQVYIRNSVLASVGVKAGMSPLSGDR